MSFVLRPFDTLSFHFGWLLVVFAVLVSYCNWYIDKCLFLMELLCSLLSIRLEYSFVYKHRFSILWSVMCYLHIFSVCWTQCYYIWSRSALQNSIFYHALGVCTNLLIFHALCFIWYLPRRLWQCLIFNRRVHEFLYLLSKYFHTYDWNSIIWSCKLAYVESYLVTFVHT